MLGELVSPSILVPHDLTYKAFLNATPSIPVAMNEGAEADHAERLGALASSHDAMKRYVHCSFPAG